MGGYSRKSSIQGNGSPSGSEAGGSFRLAILILAWIVFAVGDFFLYRFSTMPGRGFRYLLVPTAVLLGLLYVGARYVQFVYNLRSVPNGFKYLASTLFSTSYPTLVVSQGEKLTKTDDKNLIEEIGGPGYVVVLPGNVALVENLMNTVRVVGSGRHFITRFERVKDVFGLEERDAKVEKMPATTKDGIEVEVRDVHYRYRLLAGPPAEGGLGRTPEDPYPFSGEAVINMVYNRNVTSAGIETWHANVNRIVETVITDYIRQNPVDHLTAPNLQRTDPRGEIYKLFNSEVARDQFKSIGAELLWVGIGHFDIPEKQVADQRASAWQAKWLGDANVVRAFGEARRAAFQELGRAEAQAEMIMSIVHALEEAGEQGDPRQRLRAINLARIAQLLDAMSKQYLPPGEPTPRA